MTTPRLTLPTTASGPQARSVALPLGQYLVGLPGLLLLALVLLTLAYWLLPPQALTVGTLDRRFISGTHEAEYIPDLGRTVRWTNSDTQLALPVVAARAPLTLALTLVNSYPDGTPPPTVRVHLGDDQLATLTVPREIHGIRTYRLLLPPQEHAGWALPLTLASSTTSTTTDPRPLGVMLAGVSVMPTGERALFPPLWQLAAFALLTAGSYYALRGVGAGRGLASTAVAGLLLALTAGILLNHWQVAPYTMRLAGLALLAALFGLATWLLSARATDGTRHLTAARWVILAGLAYWLLPFYQLIMTLDGAWDVTPYPPTLWVSLAVLVLSAFGVALLAEYGQRRRWEAWVIGVLAVAAVVHLAVMIHFAIGRSGPDFWILFRGARDWFRGGSMYNLEAVATNHYGHVFKVPPFYGMLFLPFVQMDGLAVLFWHRMLNSVLLAGSVLLIFRAYRLPLFAAVGAGVLLLFNLRPIADTIAYGQVDIALLLLLLLALVATQAGRAFWAGVALSLATLFKLYPAALLAFFVIKREWRALWGFAAGMLVFNGIALLVVGWQMHAVYLFEVLPRIGGGTSWVENQTLNGVVSRLVSGTIDTPPLYHPLITLATYGGFALGIAGACWLAWQPAERTSPRYMLQYSLFVISMVLLVPAAWMHYQTITIVAMLALLLAAFQAGSIPRWIAAAAAIGYALIGYGNQWSFYNTLMGSLTFFGVSYKFYGLVLLTVAVVAVLLRGQPTLARPPSPERAN